MLYQKRESIISYGLRFIGQPYEWGGDGRKGYGFDCSGLVLELLWSIGAIDSQDRTAQGIYDHFKAKDDGKISQAHGNLLFFGKDKTRISHIGITVNEYQFLEAGGGDSRNLGGMVRLRPLTARRDLVAHVDFLK